MKAKTSNWHSKIEAYRDCPRKYKYLYVDGVPSPGPLSSDLAFGVALHSALEVAVKGGDAEADFEALWAYYKHKDVTYTRFDWSYLNSMGQGFIRKFKKKYIAKIEPLSIEERLYGTLEAGTAAIPYEGTPDLVAKYEGVSSIIDYKTSGYRYDADKILMAEQLANYLVLARQAGIKPTPVQLVYIPFVKSTGSIQKPLVYKPTASELKAIQKDTIDWVTIMRKDSKYPRCGSSCVKGQSKCAFIERCWK